MLKFLRDLRARYFAAPSTDGVMRQFTVMRQRLAAVEAHHLDGVVACEDRIINEKMRRSQHLDEAHRAGRASAALDGLFAL